ncbi:HNH endonuclease domain-containing protein [Pontibacter anaerobius]|uniref:HNH nuclease domain-containing protein n=1 Tax=Pontibacter anaerobius TaxID=2993940 RepID=A0ABT3RIS0_9BACT|nr:HNH endonuclease domain-containing protein [Pontibacter anaerobius]MCX2741450.1 hypothetical protein [Pontibacter anaerobius]
MQVLPSENFLPVERLAGVYRHVTNSYKYYWFLAILDSLEENPDQAVMKVDDLALRMLSLVWYPLDFYKLSFGKLDSFKPIAETLSKEIQFNTSAGASNLYRQIKKSVSGEKLTIITKQVKTLVRYVPYRFQKPFISEVLKGLSDHQGDRATPGIADHLFSTTHGRVMYRYHDQDASVELHPLWVSYLQRHLHTLRGFTYFELVRFLQKHNPHVPGLSEKLFRPQSRNLSQATSFWKLYLHQNPTYTCPYSSAIVAPSKFSIDHFVPWSYVTHDLLWNLLPIPKHVNSSKGNSLPSISNYFPALSSRQYSAFSFLLENNIPKKDSLLEDYLILFGQDFSGLTTITKEMFEIKLGESIRPLMQMANNIGFKSDWIY